ncbi:hypothetical protein VTO73DRAFT_15327 [Trametes versicolor]
MRSIPLPFLSQTRTFTRGAYVRTDHITVGGHSHSIERPMHYVSLRCVLHRQDIAFFRGVIVRCSGCGILDSPCRTEKEEDRCQSAWEECESRLYRSIIDHIEHRTHVHCLS